ncbi:MAG: dihydroneopterin aldolase [Candidatus Pseudothioglobus sp.]|jgi:dihydroneopterin aldolase
MNTVYISGLRISTVIGVYDWERNIQQIVVVDLQMSADNQRAADEDNLNYTLDYGAIAAAVTAFVEASSYQLLESLAEAIAERVMADFNVQQLTLKLGKPGAVKNADDVGVIIHRTNASSTFQSGDD